MSDRSTEECGLQLALDSPPPRPCSADNVPPMAMFERKLCKAFHPLRGLQRLQTFRCATRSAIDRLLHTSSKVLKISSVESGGFDLQAYARQCKVNHLCRSKERAHCAFFGTTFTDKVRVPCTCGTRTLRVLLLSKNAHVVRKSSSTERAMCAFFHAKRSRTLSSNVYLRTRTLLLNSVKPKERALCSQPCY